jgi:hypothetical protein
MKQCRLEAFEDSSPRRWGCSLMSAMILTVFTLFPAQAGVFLGPFDSTMAGWSLPRADGGVPNCGGMPILGFNSSLRSRGRSGCIP